MSLSHRLSEQLQCPRGRAGGWVGRVMTLVNERANRISIDRLGVGPSDDILELGFGPGRGIARLAALAPSGTVCGVDQSPIMMRQARGRNAAAILNGRVDLRLGNFDFLPFPDASFDRVAAVNVAYFWHDDAAVMAEIDRVTRPAARIAVYATHRRSMEKWPFARTGGHRLFDEAELRSLFLGAGFAPDRVDMSTFAAGFGVTGISAVASKIA